MGNPLKRHVFPITGHPFVFFSLSRYLMFYKQFLMKLYMTMQLEIIWGHFISKTSRTTEKGGLRNWFISRKSM
jgi:hypothetical protein